MNMTTEKMEAREYQLAAATLTKKDKRAAASFGKGATTGAMALTGLHIPRLTAYLTEKWKTPCRANVPEYTLERMLRQLEPEVVALVCLQAGLHVASQNEKRQLKAFKVFAEFLEAECFYGGLFKGNKKLAERASRFAAKAHAAGKRRQSTARAVAEKGGFTHNTWSTEEKAVAGVWCSNLLTEALPDVFKWVEFTAYNKALGFNEKFRTLAIADEAQAYMRDVVKDLILRRPVWLPRVATPPEPWTGWKTKPSADSRVSTNVSLLRTHNQDQIRAVKAAIADGTMAPTLKGINALQEVPFKINSWLLSVMDAVEAQGIPVPGFTVADKIDVPEKMHDDQWAVLSPEERKLASETRKSAEALNRQRNGDLTLLALDMEEAHRLEGETFYLPMSMDFRGRVYPLPRFHFQRGDHVRALFLFDRGAPITEKGTYWLQVHVANCWAQKGPDGIGLDKKPMDERVQWVNENLHTLKDYVEHPLDHTGWTNADAPFLFLAAARELVMARATGADYLCHLPVSFDGSCSGLQHLAAAMRAEEGELVNLTNNDEANDIYSIVAEEARKIIAADAQGQDEKKRHYAELFLSYAGGIDRKLLKRNCMTFCYSSEGSGMGDQQYEDLMIPLQAEAIRNKTPHHFGTIKEQSAAARYMGHTAYAAITAVVKKPAEAMGYLKELAKALAHEGKPVRWVTPAGLPCVNRYHEVQTKQLQLWLHNKRISVEVAIGADPEIKKAKCQRAIAPNFVHSLDAAHLLLVVGACADEGITDVVTVHDSFGCLPSHAERFNAIIREQFVQMYQEHDVLTSCQETARADLTEANHWRLPPLPEKGSLDLNEVRQAKYAFA